MADDARYNLDPGPDPRAVAFLEAKGLQRSWRWASMWGNEHAYAFTLAGVHRIDVLAATQQLLTQSVETGETLETFQDAFEERLKALGFAGPQVVRDFEEGPRKVNLSAPWRVRVIYDTNVRQAYAAAEWQAIDDTKADFPALEYLGVDDERTRASHRRWFGVVLPVDHPFWTIYYPPNDWFCRCYVIQISVGDLAHGRAKLTTEEDLARRGFTLDQSKWLEWKHQATGRVERVPVGVGPGFGHNAGMSRRANLGDLVARKVEAMDPNMARAAAADLTNLPVFRDLVDDAVSLGVARAQAAKQAAAKLHAGGAKLRGPDLQRETRAAADAAGTFPAESWPVAVMPPEIRTVAPEAAQVVVANASAIGHSAHQHPTRPQDWRRVQLMLEHGEVYRRDGEVNVAATFQEGELQRTWLLSLKPVAGAWRVRTLHAASPRRQAKVAGRGELVRRGAGIIRFEG